MIKFPKFATINFDEIEKAGYVKFEGHYRQDLWKKVQRHQFEIMYSIIHNLSLPNLRKRNQKIALRARQMNELLDGNCSPELHLYKKNNTALAETAKRLTQRGRVNSGKYLQLTIYGIIEIWKGAGGKGSGCYWNPEKGKFEGKALDFVCKLFDQFEKKYSRNTVAVQIKRASGADRGNPVLKKSIVRKSPAKRHLHRKEI